MTWKYKREPGQTRKLATGVEITLDRWLIYNNDRPEGDYAFAPTEAVAAMFCNELNRISRDDG